MKNLRGALKAAVTDLDDLASGFALVGGFAVSMYVEERFTADADFAVAVRNDDEAELLVFALRGRGYSVGGIFEQTGTGRLSTVRLLSPIDNEVFVDLLFASSGIEPELVAAARARRFLDGLDVRVAIPGHLIALKLLSDGPHRRNDARDLYELGRIAGENDWALAAEACLMITERGYHRNRDLAGALATLRAEHTTIG